MRQNYVEGFSNGDANCDFCGTQTNQLIRFVNEGNTAQELCCACHKRHCQEYVAKFLTKGKK